VTSGGRRDEAEDVGSVDVDFWEPPTNPRIANCLVDDDCFEDEKADDDDDEGGADIVVIVVAGRGGKLALTPPMIDELLIARRTMNDERKVEENCMF
jgi:hypothetical protein